MARVAAPLFPAHPKSRARATLCARNNPQLCACECQAFAALHFPAPQTVARFPDRRARVSANCGLRAASARTLRAVRSNAPRRVLHLAACAHTTRPCLHHCLTAHSLQIRSIGKMVRAVGPERFGRS